MSDCVRHVGGVLVFAAAALHLRAREAWIGWSNEQRRRRLARVVNNVRYLLLPRPGGANLGSAVLTPFRIQTHNNDCLIHGKAVKLARR